MMTATRRRHWASVGLIALLGASTLTACAGDQGDGAEEPDTASPPAPAETTDPREVVVNMGDVPWAVPLAVNLDQMTRQQNGLYLQVIAEGQGARSTRGDSMWVHYAVWLPNGQLVDTSLNHDPPEPLDMQLGVTRLIDGWTQGVTGMRVGEKRRLVLPHQLAYGPEGHRAGIPPYSPLLYEVELTKLTPGEMPAEAPGD